MIYVELRVDDGSIYNVEISRSSGHKVLDQAAMRILRLGAPITYAAIAVALLQVGAYLI